jgi:hypothetical protein
LSIEAKAPKSVYKNGKPSETFYQCYNLKQQYIEGENKRLENDELRCFDPREIMVRVEYRFCPNMIVIDTPGLLSAPAKLRHMNEQQRQLHQVRPLLAKLFPWRSDFYFTQIENTPIHFSWYLQAAKEAEHLVLEKMKCQDYLILCVEDTTDWKHSTTRNIVMQADPDLRRTVLVTTKVRRLSVRWKDRAKSSEGVRICINNYN